MNRCYQPLVLGAHLVLHARRSIRCITVKKEHVDWLLGCELFFAERSDRAERRQVHDDGKNLGYLFLDSSICQYFGSGCLALAFAGAYHEDSYSGQTHGLINSNSRISAGDNRGLAWKVDG